MSDVSLVTRFLRSRLGRVATPAADLLQTVAGTPPPVVISRASEGSGSEPGADVVFVEQVEDHPLPPLQPPGNVS